MENIDNILNTTKLIVDKNNKLMEGKRAKGELYNIFNVLNLETSELMHSKILGNLLDSNGEDRLRTPLTSSFLFSFLELIGIYDFDSGFDFSLIHYTVSLEVDIGVLDNNPENPSGGRIDILLKDNEGNAIIIENKVYAGDQCCQLRRYKNWADKNLKNYIIIYLTLDGSAPSNYSLGLPENATDLDRKKSDFYACGEVECLKTPFKGYMTMSYKCLVPCLDKAIKNASEMPALRETLIQYRNTIKKITNNNMEENLQMELINTLATEKNIESVFAIAENLLEIKRKIFKEVFAVKLNEVVQEDEDLREKGSFVFDYTVKQPEGHLYKFNFKLKDNSYLITFEFQNCNYKNLILGIFRDLNPDFSAAIGGKDNYSGNQYWFGWKYLSHARYFNSEIFKQMFDKKSKLYEEIINETKELISLIEVS